MISDDDLIRAHADLVYRTCLRLTGNAQDAADVSQEVFIAWMHRQGSIRGPVAAWLHGTARRRCLDWLRRHHRRARHEGRSAADPPAEELGVPDPAVLSALDLCLAGLDPRLRTLVIEHHVMGISQATLAARWQVSQVTVSRHLARALERLRAGLARQHITEASLGGVPALLGTLGSGPPCPGALLSPLLASARVGGAGALVGAGSLVVWWTTWPALTAACIAGLLLAGAAYAATVRTVVSFSLPSDPVAFVLAAVPALPAIAVPPTSGVPRYRSLEAVIDRLPPRDEATQERIRAWLTQQGTSTPWTWMRIDGRAMSDGYKHEDPALAQRRQDLIAETDRRVLAAAAPLFAEIADPAVSLTGSGWLAADYRQGKFRWFKDIFSCCRGAYTEPHYLMKALGRQALAASNPHHSLATLDALYACLHRDSLLIISALYANSDETFRDNLYLRLVQRGTIAEDDVRRWCQEQPTASSNLNQAFHDEPLLLLLPQLEDAQRWGVAAMAGDSPPAGTAAPGFTAWLERPMWSRHMLDLVHLDDRLSASLAGRERILDIVEAQPDFSAWPTMKVPIADFAHSLAGLCQYAARARLTHAGRRLLAWIIVQSRAGHPLPATLDEVVPMVADGRALIGGSRLNYGLLYSRLSATRFRLQIDPASQSPDYVEPDRIAGLIVDAEKAIPSAGKEPPMVNQSTLWEADVQRLGEATAEEVELLDTPDPAPAVPPATN